MTRGISSGDGIICNSRRWCRISPTRTSKTPAGRSVTAGAPAVFPPAAVVRSQLFRALSPDRSIRNTVTQLVAADVLDHPISESAWDQARARLPEALLPMLLRRVAAATAERFPSMWRGREVYLVDGTTVSMPDESALVEAFGYTESKHGPSRFPNARLLALLHGGTRQVVDYRLAPNRISELALFRQLLPTLPKNALWVADRYFSSAVEFVLSLRANVDFLTPLHQRRDGRALAQTGRKIGADEWLVSLSISAPSRRKYAALELPEAVEARLIRVRYNIPQGQKQTKWLVTSLLDAATYPRAAVIDLYRARWGIETHYGYLKTTLQLAVLRSKTPANARKEVAAVLLAHNLVWRLMHEAGEAAGLPAARISFTGACRAALAYGPRLRGARTEGEREMIRNELLRHIAGLVVPDRPGRHEPRLIKRVPQNFPTLRVSRTEARRCA